MIMKKRVCISIILTVFAVVFTNHFWLVRKPLDVTFYALGDNISSIDVQLSKEKSPDFKKFKSRTSGEDISAGSSLEFQFKKPRQPKWLKIVANTASHGGGATLTLSDIRLKDHKYKLNALDKFSAKSADLKISDNQLVITPKEESFELLYNKQLKVRGSIKFDVKILLIIIILTYLAGYKLTSYLADFKIEENKSRIDIIFLTIFFIMLFIPMMKISDDEISKKENRRLAAYKPFIEHNEINFNFGKDFDSWFSDRFLLREEIIPVYNYMNYLLHTDYVQLKTIHLYKSTNWMLGNGIEIPFTETQLKQISSNLFKLKKFCNDNNIKLYVIIAPGKNSYQQNVDKILKKVTPNRTVALVEYAKVNYGLDIIYPEATFRNADKNEYIYFKTDHHLTDYGAYLMYSQLINKMKTDFPLLYVTPEGDFNTYKRTLCRYESDHNFREGETYRGAAVNAEKLLNTEYLYYDYKYPETITIKKDKNNYEYPFLHLNSKGHYKLMILGNSYQENITYFLNTNFKEIRKYRLNSSLETPKRRYETEMRPYEKIAEDYKPDAVLLIVTSGYAENLTKMYPSEEE